jgi:hypothetical protein
MGVFHYSLIIHRDIPEKYWEDFLDVFDRKLPDRALQFVAITGHGSSHVAGPFTMDNLKDKDSGPARFLRLLGKKMATNAEIELRVCSACSGGKDIAKRIAKLTGRTTYGYTGCYYVYPSGKMWFVMPNEDVEEGPDVGTSPFVK